MFSHSPLAFQFESLYPGRGSCSLSDKLRLVVVSAETRIRREIALYLTRHDDVSTVSPFRRDSCRRPCSSVTRSISFFSARYCETHSSTHTHAYTYVDSEHQARPQKVSLRCDDQLCLILRKFLASLVVIHDVHLPRFLILILTYIFALWITLG